MVPVNKESRESWQKFTKGNQEIHWGFYHTSGSKAKKISIEGNILDYVEAKCPHNTSRIANSQVLWSTVSDQCICGEVVEEGFVIVSMLASVKKGQKVIKVLQNSAVLPKYVIQFSSKEGEDREQEC